MDVVDLPGLRENLESFEFQESHRLLRRRTKAILEFGQQFLQILQIGDIGEFAVELDLFPAGGDVGAGEVGGDGEVDGDVSQLTERLFFEATDGVFEELAVEFVTDGGDVTGLFGSEDISRTSNFEIAHGDAESGTEFTEFLDGLEAFGGIGAEALAGFDEEVAVGAVFVTTDASPKLMEIGESVAFGFVDEDSIGFGDVESAFDDRCGDEDIEVACHEGDHDLFEFVFRELSVGDADGGFGDDSLELIGEGFDVVDLVVDEVDLTTAVEFAHDGGADQLIVHTTDAGFDPLSVVGGGGEVRDVAYADQGEVKRTGDGGGAEGKDIDFEAEFFEALFGIDAESLFFVDDEETEVVEFDVLLDDAVGTDDEIDGSRFEAFESSILL